MTLANGILRVNPGPGSASRASGFDEDYVSARGVPSARGGVRTLPETALSRHDHIQEGYVWLHPISDLDSDRAVRGREGPDG